MAGLFVSGWFFQMLRGGCSRCQGLAQPTKYIDLFVYNMLAGSSDVLRGIVLSPAPGVETAAMYFIGKPLIPAFQDAGPGIDNHRMRRCSAERRTQKVPAPRLPQ